MKNVLFISLMFFLFNCKPDSVTKWEYKIESPSDYTFKSEMNVWGEDGWELVFARRATSRGYKGDPMYECIFKRKILNNE